MIVRLSAGTPLEKSSLGNSEGEEKRVTRLLTSGTATLTSGSNVTARMH